MILLALLVGSDYTIGIQGIGPVTALEILAAFPPAKQQNDLSQSELISGLHEFKHWLSDGGKLGLGRTKLRSKLQNIQISTGFPSLQVVQAYLKPEVETNEDKFSWGKPDVVGLIDFAREKFGWTRMKAEEILNPVIKKLEDVSKQKSIRDYFATKHKIDFDLSEGKVSKRVKMAIERMGKSTEELRNEEQKNTKQKGKANKDKKVNETRKARRKEQLKSVSESEKTENKDEDKSGSETLNKTEKLLGLEKSVANDNEKIINEAKTNPIQRPQKYTTIDKSNVQRKRKTGLHEKEVIPQRERDKKDALKSKLRAIEIYRKSKIEGKHEKKVRKVHQPKEDAELSESSDSS